MTRRQRIALAMGHKRTIRFKTTRVLIAACSPLLTPFDFTGPIGAPIRFPNNRCYFDWTTLA